MLPTSKRGDGGGDESQRWFTRVCSGRSRFSRYCVTQWSIIDRVFSIESVRAMAVSQIQDMVVDGLTLFVWDRRTESTWTSTFIAYLREWLQIVDSHASCTPINLQPLRPSHRGVARHAFSCYRFIFAFLRAISGKSFSVAIAPSRITVD